MPTTTELKLSNNCWHSLCYQYSFLSTWAFHFYIAVGADVTYIVRLQCPVSWAFHFYPARCKNRVPVTVAMPCLLGFSFLLGNSAQTI